MAIRWQFVETARGRDVSWTWRVLLADGTTNASLQSFETYGVAVHDAIRHGFFPSEHEWSIISGAGVAHFHCGHDPVMVTSGTRAPEPRFKRRKPQRTHASESEALPRVPPKRTVAGKRPPGK